MSKLKHLTLNSLLFFLSLCMVPFINSALYADAVAVPSNPSRGNINNIHNFNNILFHPDFDFNNNLLLNIFFMLDHFSINIFLNINIILIIHKNICHVETPSLIKSMTFFL